MLRNFFKISGLYFVIAASLYTFIASGCKDSSAKQAQSAEKDVVTGYAAGVYTSYLNALESAKVLQAAVEQFLAAPSDSTQNLAKDAWVMARQFYGQTEVFRFYDGPIDNGETGVEGLLNAWPLDEAYVDYVNGAPASGIIQNTTDYPEITRELLVSLNEKGGEENISCGYHAVEFMLWGQDLDSIRAGNRQYTDFISGNTENDRRRTYLQLTADLLVEHLTMMVMQWSPKHSDNYRATFEMQDTKLSLQKILTGMGVLAKVELAGERMYTAYDNADQEDEQSCFSDNTRADLIANLQGLHNVLYGSFPVMQGDSLKVAALLDLLRTADPAIAQNLADQLYTAEEKFGAIPQPFDRALTHPDYRKNILSAILAVQKLGDACSAAAGTLGLTINLAAAP